MSSFCDVFDCTSLIKEPTCYKNPDNPSCIDLILTNKPLSFQFSCVAETELYDCHRMILTVTKMKFQKLKPKVINHRNFKYLTVKSLEMICWFYIISFNEFFNMCWSTLDQHALRKQKYARENHMPFTTKTLSKEIMKRTKLPKNFLEERTDESKKRYTSQRNYCVSRPKKTKKN